MKIAVASLLVASLAVATAFVPSNNAFVRSPTNLNMASPAEFAKAEIEGNDVSSRRNKPLHHPIHSPQYPLKPFFLFV
jgi:hypothetical protein